jgi:hypothetical protein
MTADLALFLALAVAVIGFIVWIARKAESGANERADRAEDEADEVKKAAKNRSKFDASGGLAGALGRWMRKPKG